MNLSLTAVTNTFISLFQHEKRPGIDYLVGQIGPKLSLRTAPEKGYVGKATVKDPIDHEIFKDLFGELGYGRDPLNAITEDLDFLLSAEWTERAFRTRREMCC